ncbi:DUF4136 domain-containing protein [Bacterioplanoides sp. SCSIO 12839]|uniref:DUF4136 domain-containing protein n=1 Tax=Bacterioplanoides sp. SCSIO 12839 TaxID=2829569 RepID=UPI0021052538|nr:DUF4136 domain-containing protein [Bacterioplanoides sp. SCSIO 12839]UTW49644.1 DUF4136 domain-containing protein [Bacterioplanoides sp. SCSIO 12839]
MKLLAAFITACFLIGCSANAPLDYRQSPDRHAADYQTFTLKSIDNVKGTTPQAMGKVGQAIKFALEQKGLKYVDQGADLLVEYAVGVKNTQKLNMQYYPTGQGMYTRHDVASAKIAKLVININDVADKRSIWLTSGSSEIAQEEKTQDEINQAFVAIFAHFE